MDRTTSGSASIPLKGTLPAAHSINLRAEKGGSMIGASTSSQIYSAAKAEIMKKY